MVDRCPYCRSPLIDEGGYCQMCGAEVRPAATYRRFAAPASPQPIHSRNHDGLIIAVVVVLVILVVGIGILALAYLGSTSSTVHECKLTVTVSNSSIFSDKEYRLYFDGELQLEDAIEAGYVATITYNMTWVGPAPVRSISVVWAGGTQTQNVQLIENAVVSVSFTL